MRRADYAMALRCIAQDLELRGIKTFDIRAENKDYLVQCGYQNPPAEMPVTVRYTAEDIDELEALGRDKRGMAGAQKEFLNLAQILRTIGGYLDKNEARLVRISNTETTGSDPLFRVEYETREGERMVDDRAGSAIYDMCVVMYKQRGRLTGTHAPYGRRR